MTLRKYQEEAISKMVWARGLEGNDVVSIACGGGKSLIISEFAKQLAEPVLILVPSKEILEQNRSKLERWTKVNTYSASVGEKTIGNITIATIQSVYKIPEMFKDFKVVIIDECDTLNPKSLTGMYNQFFKDIGNPKVYGLTGTPFRLDSYYERYGQHKFAVQSVTCIKMINRYKERFWGRMLFVVNADELLKKDYLCPLKYIEQVYINQSLIPLNKSRSDFDLGEYDRLSNQYLGDIARIIHRSQHRSKLVFCSTIEQAESLSEMIDGSVVVTGETPKKKRGKIIEAFKEGRIKTVLNVNCLSVGFDHPELDSIFLVRPTKSIRLYVQQCGRGMRQAPGKTHCTIYDFAGNVDAIGRVETIKIAKDNNLWDVVSEIGTWHKKPLYTHEIKKPKFYYFKQSQAKSLEGI